MELARLASAFGIPHKKPEMGNVPSSDDSFCRMVLTRRMAGLKHPVSVAGDDMVCDKMVSDDLSASPLTMSGSCSI